MSPSPKLLIPGTLALVLASCGGTSTPQASEQPTVTVIEGRVTGASGTGTVSVSELPGVAATTAADGRFTLTLPQGAALGTRVQGAAQVMAGLQCAGSLGSSDTSARGYLVANLQVGDGAGTRSVSAVQGSKTGLLSRSVSGRAWLYVDKDTRLSGSLDCAQLLNVPQISTLPVTIDVIARAGWNVVDLTIGASANLLGQVSAGGSVVNSAAGTALSEWRTAEELQAQISF
ncbi:hypothetical protein [Deinococcus petrolearius]|uniref:Carboxypeptidase regulatory-like domain-containing protein n=1 Tax=Deinococcus petrolearius TaxID=1751295 RepID=A0ABW1DHD0_9DEIO